MFVGFQEPAQLSISPAEGGSSVAWVAWAEAAPPRSDSGGRSFLCVLRVSLPASDDADGQVRKPACLPGPAVGRHWVLWTFPASMHGMAAHSGSDAAAADPCLKVMECAMDTA